VTTASLALRIDAVLPQTQCTCCGYDGCMPYARALASGEADLDRCPPGGDAVVLKLSELTGRRAKPVDPACGAPGPLLVAVIDEAACIGCTLCIAACPVDAIIGAPKRMHAVLPSLCSGCELCVPPCPVDCIAIVSAQREWTAQDASAARERHAARDARVARRERIANRKAAAVPQDAQRDKRRAAVAAALVRARARRAARA
jgi:electron transport complex protein RnfB